MGQQNMRTPRWLFDHLNHRFGPFELDAAATHEAALCPRYYTPKEDGLVQNWNVPTFCNPPFRNFGKWIRKGFIERYTTVVCMIGPVGCSQEWFHKYARHGTVYAPTKRISFNNPDGSPTSGADRDTMIYLFGPDYRGGIWPAFKVLPIDIPRGGDL